MSAQGARTEEGSLSQTSDPRGGRTCAYTSTMQSGPHEGGAAMQPPPGGRRERHTSTTVCSSQLFFSSTASCGEQQRVRGARREQNGQHTRLQVGWQTVAGADKRVTNER